MEENQNIPTEEQPAPANLEPPIEPIVNEFLAKFLSSDKYDLTLKTFLDNKKLNNSSDKAHHIWQFATVALILGAIVFCAWFKIIEGLSVGILISAILGYVLSSFKQE